MMSRTHSLSTRIAGILTLLVLLMSLLGVSLIGVANFRLFETQASRELERGERIFRNLLQQHDQQLIQAAQLLTADYGFRSAVASSDTPTIRSALDNQRQRIQAGLAFLSSPEGRVIADSGSRVGEESPYPFPGLLAQAEKEGKASGIVAIAGKAYVVVIVPVKAPLIVGWLTMGVPVDDAMATDFQSLSGLQVSFVQKDYRGWQVVSSTLPEADRKALAEKSLLNGILNLSKTAYESRLIPLASIARQDMAVVLQRPMDELLVPFYALLKMMMALVVVGLVLNALVSLRIARVVTKPLQLLVESARRIRDGDYQHTIPRPTTRELQGLADTLGHMQTAIAERESHILHMVYHDSLTGLLNRRGFLYEAEKRLQPGHDHTVVLLNIDRFQQINDTLGHPFGDEVLIAFAQQLRRSIPAQVTVARFSGDEFALLLPHPLSWVELINGLRQRFEEPIQVGDRSLDVRATMGFAHYPEHATEAIALMCCADEAMYVAKASRSPARAYNPERKQFREDHLSLLGQLKKAVEGDQLMLYYQPKVSLLTGEVHEAEALIRWQHPQRGFVPPVEFIPFAEQTGYIRELTQWVIQRGCRDAATLLAQGRSIRISVNIATRDLLDLHLTDYVSRCLEKSHLPPEYLCLEITESGMMEESELVMDNLQQLRRIGVSLAIDDYGTGYSSLAYVRRLPVSELKIDRSFVVGVADSHADAMIVHSTIELAHSLNFKVVAEGVETEAVSNRLRELGCDIAQGYLYSRPLSFADFQGWLLSR